MSLNFTPKTRLEKILCGIATSAKTRLEKAVKYAIDNAGSGGGSSLFEVVGTFGVDEKDKTTITINKTAEEAYTAISQGKMIRLTGDAAEGLFVDAVDSIGVIKFVWQDNDIGYVFRFINENGTIFKSDTLAATDQIVITAQ